MNTPRTSAGSIVAAVAACLLLTACSRGGSDDLAEPVPSTPPASDSPAEPSTLDTAATADDPSDEQSDDPTDAVATADDATVPGASQPSTAPTSTIIVTLPPIETVAEVGVPGLDSDDVFCASWSRFAGSFQVVAVTAAFGSGSPEQLASLEIVASPTVTEAYDDLVSNWPDELSSEADLVAEDFLGPFARRLEVARDALEDAGVDDATVTTISDAWLDGLAQRDPTTPEFVVDLSDDVWAVVDAAAEGFAAQRVPFSSDPSLVTNVQTPLTTEYLATTCPDQGTLSGQEVGTP